MRHLHQRRGDHQRRVIMVAVFSILATLPIMDTKTLGIGLAAVLLDATVVRGILLPAIMSLLGSGADTCRAGCPGCPAAGQTARLGRHAGKRHATIADAGHRRPRWPVSCLPQANLLRPETAGHVAPPGRSLQAAQNPPVRTAIRRSFRHPVTRAYQRFPQGSRSPTQLLAVTGVPPVQRRGWARRFCPGG